MLEFLLWGTRSLQVKIISAVVIAALLSACGIFVYFTGGIKYVFSHSMYIPVVLAAFIFGPQGGLVAGLVGGLILGPYMPINTVTGEMQLTVNWVFRLAFFCLIGGLVGYVVQLLTQAKNSLQQWHDLMQYIIRHDPNAIAVHDHELKYIFVSERYLKDYRINEADIIGRHHYEVFPDIPQKWRDVHQRALKSEAISAEEDIFVRKDGSIDYTTWHCRPWHQQDGSIGGIILYTEVVTARKIAEQELEKLNLELEQRIAERTAQLEDKNRELEAFAYSVSHDLKAPLRGIDGYSRLLLTDHADSLDEEGRTFLNTIRRSAERMNELIDDLLSYSRLEQQAWQSKKVNIKDLVVSAAAEIEDEVKDRGGALEIDLPAANVVADPGGLALALRNIIENAAKYSSKNKAPQIIVKGYPEKERFIVAVSDNGIGFDLKYHDQIFGIFNRLHPEGEYSGTGIGLAMVKKAMERIGGQVWAESTPGRGATFYLALPLHGEQINNNG